MSARPRASERGPNVLAPPPLLYLGPLLAGLALNRLLPLPRLPRPLRLLGLPMLVGGTALAGWFLATMRAAGTPPDPREPPTALVEEGPFRFSRNPAYLGMALVYSGVSVLAGGGWPLLLLPGVLTVVVRGVIEREEEYMAERFGERYESYRERVNRWL